MAAGGRDILNALPDLPQKGPTEAQCKALKEASLAYKAQAKAAGDPLKAQLDKAAEDLQKKMNSGTLPPRDEMIQSAIVGQLAQEIGASDTRGLCYGLTTWPDDRLEKQFAADSNAAQIAYTGAVEACPKVQRGEGWWPEEKCAKAAYARYRAAQAKLNDAFLPTVREGYLVRQKQLLTCVITASDIRAKHQSQVKGAWKAAVDPANETAEAAGFAEFLASSAASICSGAFEALPKP